MCGYIWAPTDCLFAATRDNGYLGSFFLHATPANLRSGEEKGISKPGTESNPSSSSSSSTLHPASWNFSSQTPSPPFISCSGMGKPELERMAPSRAAEGHGNPMSYSGHTSRSTYRARDRSTGRRYGACACPEHEDEEDDNDLDARGSFRRQPAPTHPKHWRRRGEIIDSNTEGFRRRVSARSIGRQLAAVENFWPLRKPSASSSNSHPLVCDMNHPVSMAWRSTIHSISWSSGRSYPERTTTTPAASFINLRSAVCGLRSELGRPYGCGNLSPNLSRLASPCPRRLELFLTPLTFSCRQVEGDIQYVDLHLLPSSSPEQMRSSRPEWAAHRTIRPRHPMTTKVLRRGDLDSYRSRD